ncbi:MAG: FAD-linked oxidase, partial [Nocardioides sp.]
GAGALPMLDAAFALFGVAVAATPELGARGHADATALVEGLGAWSAGRQYLNFAEQQVDVRSGYSDQAWLRLKGVRSAVDPRGVLRANHPVPRLYEGGRPSA